MKISTILKKQMKNLVPIFFIVAIASAVFALDNPHNQYKTINCGDCHITNPSAVWWTNQGGEENGKQGVCRSCHNPTGMGPYVQTHSSTVVSSTKYGTWDNSCTACHNPHVQRQFRVWKGESYEYSGVSTAVTATTLTRAGASWDENQWSGYVLLPNVKYPNLNYRIYGNTADTIEVDTGSGGIDRINLTYIKPGQTFGISYGMLVKEYVGYRTVKFFGNTGAKSFADGDGEYNGICEVCHTKPTHFRNDGSGSDQLHTNVNSPDGAKGTNCTQACHKHQSGFGHGGSGTGCGTSTSCHGTRGSHPTHVNNAGGRGVSLACSECHNTSAFPQFKDGQNLTNTTACNNCHSPEGSYDGVNDPFIGAKPNWASGVYEDYRSTLKSGKEKWCAGCHDTGTSTISGVNAPNVIGNESEAYTYGTGWGYYKTGHGLPNGQSYPASGGVTDGAGVQCSGCHDFSTAHIDGNARTFGSSCTSDEYRQGYRLKRINGLDPMLVPLPTNTSPLSSTYYFRLCNSCHSFDTNNPFTTTSTANTNLVTDGVNRHWYHLGSSDINSNRYDAAWGGSCNSRMTCVACHNVHGSTRLAMVRDGKLGGTEPGLKIWYYNSDIVTYSSPPDTEPTPANVTLAASEGTVWSGGSSSNLCSHCHGNNNLTTETRTPFQNLAQAPILEWAGQNNYMTDGANPDSGASGTSFTFRVKYRDANNDPPSSIQVWIDDNNNGYEPAERYTLSQVDAGDTTYHDGKLYETTRVLTNAAGNVKPYRFYAVSNGAEATGLPTNSSSVYVLNSGAGSGSAPLLAWTEEPNYTADGVHPDRAVSGSSFTFRVKYSDAENNPPAQIQVWIDADRNGAFSDAERYGMTEDGGGADYTAGRFFTRSVNLTCAGGCSMNYRFFATDGTSQATGVPTGTKTVSIANNAPTVTWTGEPNYSEDGVNPNSGAGGTDFTFRVKYSDVDNTPPSLIQVWVDTDNSGIYDDHEKFDMTQDDDDGDSLYTNGEKYTRTLKIPYVGDGTITYRLYASDGTDTAAGSAVTSKTLTITAPSGNNAPILSWAGGNCMSDGVRPGTGGSWSDYEFRVLYTDIDPGQCASEILVWVDTNDNGTYETTEKYVLTGDAGDTDCTDGRLYETALTLDTAGDGVLNYRFYASDGYVAAAGLPVTGGTVTVLNALKVRPTGGDGWYSTIQDAVDDSTSGSTILVYPNSDFTAATYAESVSLMNKSDRTLMSTCGRESAIIDGGTYSVLLQTSYNITVDGFSLAGSSYGVQSNSNVSATVQNCAIYGNNSRGINVSSATNTNLSVSDCDIYSNSGSSTGAGIYLAGGTINVENTKIYGNSTSSSGGGLNMQNANTTFRNVIISGNKAFDGGGLYFNSGTFNCYNCTISGNKATNIGGGLRVATANVLLRNSIVYNNHADGQGDEMYLFNGSSTALDYSFIKTGAPYIEGGASPALTNTISDDSNPLFVDKRDPSAAPTAEGNYHLAAGSPCINSGTITDAASPDIDGDPRPLGGGYDMGADEYDSANTAPVLAWTGEPNYTTDGVNPNSGTGSFEFRVSYSDAENTPPEIIQVWVDTDDDGSYESNEKFDMTGADINDIVYTNGKVYTRSLTLAYKGDGNLNYRFYASDGPALATGAPNSDNTVTVINSLPVGGYTDDNVIPAAQISQSGNGDGIVTINWKGRDDDSNNVTLKNLEYSVNGGSSWSAPANGDASLSLSVNWKNNGGGGYTTASTFAVASPHSFTFNTRHADVSGMAGVDQSDVRVRFTLYDSGDSVSPPTSENFRVDNAAPTDTITSANYDAAGDTMTITGTNFTSIATTGTDIRSYVDWSKLVWDINGDNAITPNITFAVGDVTSLTIINDATLSLVFTAAKGSAIEATVGYGPTGGNDTLDITAGFSKDAFGNEATTDGMSDGPLGFSQIISGMVYIDEGVTTIGDGATVRLLVNGTSFGTAAATSGVYSISTSGINAGDAILVYLDDAGTDGITVTVSSGGSLSGLNIYGNRLIARHDNGGSLSNANMSAAKGAYSDSEILYSVSGSDLTVSAGTELYVWTGHTFAPGGTVNASDVDVRGALNTAVYDINVSGNWNVAAVGVFTSTGTVTFNATSGTITIIPGGTDINHDFQNIAFNDGGGSATFQLGGALAVNGNFTLTDGIFDTTASNHAMTVEGNLSETANSRFKANASVITVGGNVSLNANNDVTESADFNSASLVLNGAASAIDYANLASWWANGFNNLTAGQGGVTDTLNNSLAIKNALAIGTGGLTGAVTLALTGSGDVVVFDAASSLSVNTLMFLNWGGVQNIPTLNNGYGCDISLGGDGVTVTQTGNVTLNSGKSLLITGDGFANRAATYNTAGYALNVGGNITMGAAGDTKLKTLNGTSSAISVKGNFAVTPVGGGSTQATFTSTGSTVTLNGTADQTITSSGAVLNNLTINNTGSSGNDDIIVADALDVNGSLTITDGDFDISANNPAVYTAGAVTIETDGTITVTGRTANWTFDGASTLTDYSSTGPQSLQNVVLNGTGLTLGSSARVKTMTVSSGTLNLGNSAYVLEIDGTGTPFANSGTFTAGNSTVKYTGSGSATNITTVAYRNLQLAPTGATTYSLTGNLTGGNALTGSLTIGSNATLSTTGSNYNIALAGNWNNSGVFTAGTGTVTLNGTGQAVNGSTAFYNLIKSVTSADTLTFEAGKTTTINGTVTLNGASGQLLTLASSTGSSYWYFVVNAGATKAIDYVNVSWSNAASSDASQKPIAPTNSVDGGNNVSWFGSANAAPVLGWATASCLTEGVRPRTGAVNADFEFRVVYSDADNECPSYIRVTVNSTDYDLTSNDGASCQTGRTYWRSIALASSGDLNYSFSASDGTDDATGAPTGTKAVSVINTSFKVKPGGTSPWYSTIGAAVTASSDPSTIIVYPNSDFTAATYSESVNLMNKSNRTLISACGPESTIIDGGTYAVLLQTSYNITLGGFSHIGSSYGIQANGNTSATIQNCDIFNNTSRGLNVSSGTNVTLTVSNCDIYSNSGSSAGVGIYLNGGTITVENSKIYGNSTTASGGGLNMQNANTTFRNVIITGNKAFDGGGLYFNSGTFNCYNCTISGNKATNVGGGLRVATATVTLRNGIVYNNHADGQGDELYLLSGSTTLDYSFIKTGAPYIEGGGSKTLTNIISDDSNTLFVDGRPYSEAPTVPPSNIGNYHLRANSPCIDTGTSTDAVSPDIDGDSRPQGGGYDMGADEYVP